MFVHRFIRRQYRNFNISNQFIFWWFLIAILIKNYFFLNSMKYRTWLFLNEIQRRFYSVVHHFFGLRWCRQNHFFDDLIHDTINICFVLSIWFDFFSISFRNFVFLRIMIRFIFSIFCSSIRIFHWNEKFSRSNKLTVRSGRVLTFKTQSYPKVRSRELDSILGCKV